MSRFSGTSQNFRKCFEAILQSDWGCEDINIKSTTNCRTLVDANKNIETKEAIISYFEKFTNRGIKFPEAFSGCFAVVLKSNFHNFETGLNYVFRIAKTDIGERDRQKIPHVLQPDKVDLIKYKIGEEEHCIKIERLPQLKSLREMMNDKDENGKPLLNYSQAMKYIGKIQESLRKEGLRMYDATFQNIAYHKGRLYILDPDTVVKQSEALIPKALDYIVDIAIPKAFEKIHAITDSFIGRKPVILTLRITDYRNANDYMYQKQSAGKLDLENIKNLKLPSPFVATQNHFNKCVSETIDNAKSGLSSSWFSI